jgi:mannose-6-phosphate isomerase-like protein (cupin superfamily)
VSLIFVAAPPGAGPALHRHPYPELFLVEAGEAKFSVGDAEFVARAGEVVVGPAEVPHGFTNAGAVELRLTAIHCAGRFTTRWERGPDRDWVSKPQR